MSGPVRVGVIFGLAIVGAILGSQLLGIAVPLGGCLGFLSVIALGLAAGYTAAKVTNAGRDQRIGRGATAGAIAGVVTLIGTAIVTFLVSLLPAYQDQVAQALQDPALAGSGIDPAALASGLGAIGGLCVGGIYLVILVLCGLLGSLFWRGAAAGDYVAAGGSVGAPSGGSYIPNQTNQPYGGQPTGTTNVDPTVRVYDDPNDPNRR